MKNSPPKFEFQIFLPNFKFELTNERRGLETIKGGAS
jgi:hypothetical protein